jgi:hypothetical protein
MYKMSSLIHVSAWERVSLWRRLLCAFGRVTILLLVVIGTGVVVYAKRYQLMAKVWHWRHGGVTKIGNYDVPVPEHWYPEQDATSLLLMNTASWHASHDGKFHATATVGVGPFRGHPTGTREMDLWLSLQRQRLDREGLTSVLEKTVRFDDEDMICVGGDELNTVMRSVKGFPNTSVVTLNCTWPQGLNIMFVGEPSDLETFYNWASQIHRRQ